MVNDIDKNKVFLKNINLSSCSQLLGPTLENKNNLILNFNISVLFSIQNYFKKQFVFAKCISKIHIILHGSNMENS